LGVANSLSICLKGFFEGSGFSWAIMDSAKTAISTAENIRFIDGGFKLLKLTKELPYLFDAN
jgi:hypothetical protein